MKHKHGGKTITDTETGETWEREDRRWREREREAI